MLPKTKTFDKSQLWLFASANFSLRVFDFVEILCRHGLVVLSDL
jgi:hypothetical protein